MTILAPTPILRAAMAQLGHAADCREVLLAGLIGDVQLEDAHFLDVIDAVWDTMPRFVLVECVRGLGSPRNAEKLAVRVAALTGLGYHVEARVVDAADAGCDTSVKRMFIAGIDEEVRRQRVRDVNDWRGTHAPIWWPQRRSSVPFELGRRPAWAFPLEAYRALLQPNVR